MTEMRVQELPMDYGLRTCHIEQKIQFLQNAAATVEHGRPAVSDREDKLS